MKCLLRQCVKLTPVFCPPTPLQRKHQEIRAMRSQLKKIEDLGAAMEEALILDNKYTEHSTVGLAQQWDQLDQLGMRMQHNLEQQIQARSGPVGNKKHTHGNTSSYTMDWSYSSSAHISSSNLKSDSLVCVEV